MYNLKYTFVNVTVVVFQVLHCRHTKLNSAHFPNFISSVSGNVIGIYPSRVQYQGQGSVIDRSQSPAHESGTVCLLRCERSKTTNSSKSC